MKLAAAGRFVTSRSIRVALVALVALSMTGCSSAGEWEGDDDDDALDTPLEGTTSSALTGSPAAGTTVVTTTRLNMRSGPSTSSSILRTLPTGTRLSLLSSTSQNGFYRVSDDAGRVGHCHGAYLVAASGSTSTPTPTTPTTSAFPTTGTFKARGTGYYPDDSALEGGFFDRKGAKLRTLQQYLAGQADYVSVAMDVNAFPYGQKLRIRELEAKYGRVIEFRVVDTGGAFRNQGRSRIDVCVANNAASLDPTINGTLTLAAID